METLEMLEWHKEQKINFKFLILTFSLFFLFGNLVSAYNFENPIYGLQSKESCICSGGGTTFTNGTIVNSSFYWGNYLYTNYNMPSILSWAFNQSQPETDTLQSVTDRGSSTTNNITTSDIGSKFGTSTIYGNGATLTAYGVSNYPNALSDPVPFLVASSSQVPMAFYSESFGGIAGYIKGDDIGRMAFGGALDVVFEAGGFGASYERMRIQNNGGVTIGDEAFSIANNPTTGNLMVQGEVKGTTLTDGTCSISTGVLSGCSSSTYNATYINLITDNNASWLSTYNGSYILQNFTTNINGTGNITTIGTTNSTNLTGDTIVATNGLITNGQLYLPNNFGFSGKDSGGTYRRLYLLTAANDIQFGSVDAGWAGSTVLKGQNYLQLTHQIGTVSRNELVIDTSRYMLFGIGLTAKTTNKFQFNNSMWINGSITIVSNGNATVNGTVDANSYTLAGTTMATDTYVDGVDTQIAFKSGLALTVSTAYDESLMKDISYLYASDEKNFLTPIKFKWNEIGLKQFINPEKETGWQTGYKASDVKKLYPECIVETTLKQIRDVEKVKMNSQVTEITLKDAYVNKEIGITMKVNKTKYKLSEKGVAEFTEEVEVPTAGKQTIKVLDEGITIDEDTGKLFKIKDIPETYSVKEQVDTKQPVKTYNKNCINLYLTEKLNKICIKNPDFCI